MQDKKEPTDFGKLFEATNYQRTGWWPRMRHRLQLIDDHTGRYPVIYGGLMAVFLAGMAFVALNLQLGRPWF